MAKAYFNLGVACKQKGLTIMASRHFWELPSEQMKK